LNKGSQYYFSFSCPLALLSAPRKRYQVFVSSTYVDLIDERNAVIQALLEMDFIPCGMELFPAADEDQWSLIRRVIDDCDYYVVIVAARYGSIGPGGKSYTQLEYEYAVAQGKPAIAFLHSNTNSLPNDQCEQTDQGKVKLQRFRDLCQGRMCKPWKTSESLAAMVCSSLSKLVHQRPGVGWIRADTAVNHQAIEAQDFFYTLDERPETSFPSMVQDAKSVRIMARTAVNLLSQYERLFDELSKRGCGVKLLFISPESEASKYVYGSNPEAFEDNLRKMRFHLSRLKVNASFEAKTINHAPTISLILIERSDPLQNFAVVQLYFLHSRVARDRPLFRVGSKDKWHSAFNDEFDKLWSEANDVII
jgi:hypothetical protein